MRFHTLVLTSALFDLLVSSTATSASSVIRRTDGDGSTCSSNSDCSRKDGGGRRSFCDGSSNSCIACNDLTPGRKMMGSSTRPSACDRYRFNKDWDGWDNCERRCSKNGGPPTREVGVQGQQQYDDDGEAQQFSLPREMLEISYEAAKLSNISYEAMHELTFYGDVRTVTDADDGSSSFITENFARHPNLTDYDSVTFYTQEPDQALVAKRGNRCFVAFRGTNGPDVADWMQNINPRDREIYRDNNPTSEEHCEARKGFVDFVDVKVMQDGLEEVVKCMDSISCDREDETSHCLVLTGHSQGGASATIASVLLHWLKPTVITFGQPPTLDGGCDLVPSSRYYRFINSVKEADENDDVAFDPVVYAPTIISNSKHYGHAILLGEDPTSVKYLGLDEVGAAFKPAVWDRQNELLAHLMGKFVESNYDLRVKALLDNSPITTDGFKGGTFCDRAYPELCAAGSCSRENVCA